MILDCRSLKKKGIEVSIVKTFNGLRLPCTNGFFPGGWNPMITNRRDVAELDRFCDAMISIRQEIEAAF
jgi:glycine dehydrogenase